MDNLFKREAFKKYLCVTILILLAGLRFAYLQADFPLDLGANDMVYTDEGWWARNAIALVKEGHWYIDDGYNTINSLPVVPILQSFWFHWFGISLGAARALTVICSLLISALVYSIVRREVNPTLAWLAPLIILSSYSLFAYSRLAILEMPMILLLVISLSLVLTDGRWIVCKAVGASFFLR